MRPLLRLVPIDSPNIPGSSAASAFPKSTNGHKPKSLVLMVEDDILVRMPVAGYLRENGYDVIEAANASEAQAVLQSGQPIEIVFSDINMPGNMDGVALSKWLLGKYPDMKIILTSGVAVPKSESTNVFFLPKPYDLETLAGHLKKMLGV
jgi:DNA-binding NtrC family response regulator